ncbi:MAG: multiple antibiotic resistance protein [Maribacter sp.]|jgi:multiple antibiotic resistance protein
MIEIITTLLFLIAVIDPFGTVPVYLKATTILIRNTKER